MIALPDPDDLSAEQRRVLDLRLDESHLVTGPPGSGKTVMAIYRAEMLHRTQSEPTLLLMYGKLLSRYTTGAVRSLGIEGQVRTYLAWFTRWFSQTYQRRVPKESTWNPDWDECFRIIGESPPPPKLRPHLIVDEGQDLPPKLFAVLDAIATSMTVFADENQRITENQSTLDQIKAATGITSTATLDRNFRNTKAIAAVASTFYTGAGEPPVELVGGAADGDPPVLDADDAVKDVIARLIRYESTHRTEQIGVVLPYKKQLKSFYNRLNAKTANPVEIYFSGQDEDGFRPLDFACPGIKLVSWASTKGLEFDTVFVPELQTKRADPSDTGLRMELYVLTSRARKELHLLYSGTGEPAIIRALPMDLLDDWRD